MTDQKDGQEFNDDELQEIMGEIESLEQEFGDEGAEASAEAGDEELDLAETERQLEELETSMDEDAPEEDVAEEIEAVAEEAAPVEEDEFEEVAEVAPSHEEPVHNNVVAMDKTSVEGGNVTLGAHGIMNLNLTFQVAGKDARLVIKGSSLVVEMDGVHFQIDEQSGCVFQMPGGVKFQVPFHGEGEVSKAS